MGDTLDKPKEETRTSRPTVVRLGNGRHAQDIFIIRKAKVTHGEPYYNLYHAPTGSFVGACYYYLVCVKGMCQELVTRFPDVLKSDNVDHIRSQLPWEAKAYIEAHQFLLQKQHIEYDEWLNGPDYAALLSAVNDRPVPVIDSISEHEEELLTGHLSLGWVPDERGTLTGMDLGALIAGRRTSS